MLLTVNEFTIWVREREAVNQSTEHTELYVDEEFYGLCLRSAEGNVRAMLALRYGAEIPASDQVKYALIAPIAHWWADKWGEKRAYIQAEYESAISLLEAIAKGEAALIDLDNSAVTQLLPDTDPASGVQSVGLFVGHRKISKEVPSWL